MVTAHNLKILGIVGIASNLTKKEFIEASANYLGHSEIVDLIFLPNRNILK